MKRASRLQVARHWLERFDGRNVVRSYARHFGVDLGCAVKELQSLGVTLDPAYVKALERTLADRKRVPPRSADAAVDEDESLQFGDEQFAFIAGRTAGGAAFGVTWEELPAPDGEVAEPDEPEPGP
jgi:hypothetical protein